MALTINEVQVQWTGAVNSLSVASGASADSLEFTVDQTCFQLSVQCKADNDGTVAAGDTVDFFLLASLGDPDGAGADEFDTSDHAQFLTRLDTDSEDPAILTVPVNPNIKKGKIRAVNNSTGRAITVSATLQEKRG